MPWRALRRGPRRRLPPAGLVRRRADAATAQPCKQRWGQDTSPPCSLQFESPLDKLLGLVDGSGSTEKFALVPRSCCFGLCFKLLAGPCLSLLHEVEVASAPATLPPLPLPPPRRTAAASKRLPPAGPAAFAASCSLLSAPAAALHEAAAACTAASLEGPRSARAVVRARSIASGLEAGEGSASSSGAGGSGKKGAPMGPARYGREGRMEAWYR